VPWAIARTALELSWRSRGTKLAVSLCAMSMFVHGIVLTAQVVLERLTRDAPGMDVGRVMLGQLVGDVHTVLSTFIGVQMFACAFLLAMVGAGLVAEDRRTGAMELYFSRPLRRRDYVAGKLLAAGLVPVGTLVVPFVLLWLYAWGTAPPGATGALAGLLLPGLCGALVAALVLTSTIMGLSALGQRGRTVGVVYVVSLLVLSSAGDELPENGHAWAGYLSPLRNVQTVADAALDASGGSMLLSLVAQRPETNASVELAVVCLLGLSALGLAVLVWRARTAVAG